jgi:phosphomannomutase
MRRRRSLFRLEPRVQHYAWGDERFIPALVGADNEEGRPWAELWMGAHPDLPSRVGEESLAALIANDGEALLGRDVHAAFDGELPYLIKVLSAARPLSLQAHPSAEQAKAGFDREEAAGIPLGARERSYKDRRGKPELLAALTDFYALVGFRSLDAIEAVLEEVPELKGFHASYQPNEAGLRALFERMMRLPQNDVDAILEPIVSRLKRRSFDKGRREYWIARCDETFRPEGRHDRGLLAILLLNLVHLRPWEAIYLGPGVLHSYLEGSGIEIMSSSNNVLRGGLTEKHVDLPELSRTLVFEGSRPEILHPAEGLPGERYYPTSAREFELSLLDVTRERPFSADSISSAEILFVADCDGSIAISTDAETLELPRGGSAFVAASSSYRLSGRGRVARASVPGPTPRFRGRRPRALGFGTSGLRGLVDEITDLEAFINTRGFLDFLLERREIHRGDPVSLAGDLRPSTGRILEAVFRAISDSGFRPDYQGRVPTPALAHGAISRGRSSIMVTGSHIPFDRNGIKFNRPTGEVLKADEAAILEAVARVRAIEYERAKESSPFGDDGMLREGARRELSEPKTAAREMYARRYLDFLPEDALSSLRVVCYQHSAVGRDLLVEILTGLGAQVLPMGRSETFVPLDTEDVSEEKLRELERLAAVAKDTLGEISAVVSTDGDSDRPLVVGLHPNGRARFLPGDLLGVLVADYLDADGIVVPVSANDAVDLHFENRGIRPRKTRIGSPYVIAGMEELSKEGPFRRVVGWEANGGFLTGTEIERGGRRLSRLPTRDAVLPILSVLHQCVLAGASLVELLSRLPPRFGKSGLIDGFPAEAARAILKRFSGGGASGLAEFFGRDRGFGALLRVDETDGLRMIFEGGDVAHVRPSGNAPQLRIYAVADSEARASAIVKMAVAEPDGILRRLAQAVSD